MKSIELGRIAGILLATLTLFLLTVSAGMAHVTTPTPLETAEMFGTVNGDPFTSIFLNQMFGPLFPAVSGSNSTTVFSELIGYFNVICLVLGGLMFFWNVTIGIMQSAHEGSVLGQRWSSLWAPLRVIFAVGLLVPVPGLGGYNLAQAGVAYVVRGSTNIASSVWTAAATMVIDGVAPITASPPKVDPSMLANLFENEACRVILNTQLARVQAGGIDIGAAGVESFTYTNPDTGKTVQTSFMRDAAGEFTNNAICGAIITPELPYYITNMTDNGTIQGIPGSARAAIATRFTQAHANTISILSNGVPASNIKGVNTLVAEMMPAAYDNSLPLPDISADIARLYEAANTQLSIDLNAIMDLAVGADRNGSTGRQALRDRITGGSCATGASADASSLANDSVKCYGEGWIGAGSWYMMLAQLNNEIATLTNARPDVTVGTFIADTGAGTRAAYVAAGGYEGITGNMLSGQDNRAADAGFAPYEESALWMGRIKQAFNSSTAPLAALGFPMSSDQLQALTQTSEPSTLDDVLSYIPGLQTSVDTFGQYVLDFTSPGGWSADPMIGLMNIGNFLLTMGAAINLGAFVGGIFTGGASATILTPLANTMLTAGGLLSFVLPLMPFFYWVLAVTGYFLLIVEAVVAVNLWALGHMRMDGEGISGEGGRMGWLMILSLTMTPILMIFGFLIGMTIFRVTSALVDLGINNVYAAIIGGNLFVELIGIITMAIMMCMIYMAILERSFSLVSELPGRVLRWMGADANITNGEENRVRMTAAATGASLARGSAGITNASHRAGATIGLSKQGSGARDENGRQVSGWARSGLDRLRTQTIKGNTPGGGAQNDTGGSAPPGGGGGTGGGGAGAPASPAAPSAPSGGSLPPPKPGGGTPSG